MPCYHPLKGWRSRYRDPVTKKRSIVFQLSQGLVDKPETLPCGRCIGCKLQKSREWAIRMTHEASLYDDNCFITLTYDDEHLPKNGSLDYGAPPLFMMRLREKYGAGIRSYGCAEYGDQFGRPHYHICLFNFNFKDRTPWKKHKGFQYWRSQELEKLWPYGHSVVADFSFETAAYVARYVTKKLSGPRAADYEMKDQNGEPLYDATGEIVWKCPEKSVCISRMPGIGRPWLEAYNRDVYPFDEVVLGERKLKPPKYYDRLFEIDKPEIMAKVKAQRRNAVKEALLKGEDQRLHVREKIHNLKAAKLKRGYETNEN